MWPIRNFGGFQSNHRNGTAYSRQIKHVCYIDSSNSITYNQQQECGCGHVTVFKFRHDAARHTSLSATTELLVLFNLCSGVCNVTNGLQTFVLYTVWLCLCTCFVFTVCCRTFQVDCRRWKNYNACEHVIGTYLMPRNALGMKDVHCSSHYIWTTRILSCNYLRHCFVTASMGLCWRNGCQTMLNYV